MGDDPNQATPGAHRIAGGGQDVGEGPGGGGEGPGGGAQEPGVPLPPGVGGRRAGVGGGDPGAEDADVEALRRQLADAPADVVVANHCYGLFELAAVYLSHSPPRLEQARLAIDALGALIEGLGERLGEASQPLRDALGQIRLAYVQIAAASEGAPASNPSEASRSEGSASS